MMHTTYHPRQNHSNREHRLIQQMPNPEFPFPPQGMPSYEQLLHDRQSLAQQLQAELKANMAMLSNGFGLQDMVAKRAFAEQQSAWDQLRAPTAMGTGIPLFPNMYM